MAKRKRLTLPDPSASPTPQNVTEPQVRDGFAAKPPALSPDLGADPGARPGPPIAQVAGDAAARAAFDEVSRELADARAEGRMVVRVPLAAIDARWLTRDRADPGSADTEEMRALIESLRAHGQRTPIELWPLSDGTYGLISGWRRLTALTHLHAETGEERFASALAFLRSPETAADAYVAMVEENEIRLGLSNFERAGIVVRAVEAGVFETEKEALNRMFGSVSRSKRSKIGSFTSIFRRLDGALVYANQLGERLGLVLARELEARPGLGLRLRDLLEDRGPKSPEEEAALIQKAIVAEAGSDRPFRDIFAAPPPFSAAPPVPDWAARQAPARPAAAPRASTSFEVIPGVVWEEDSARVRLSGAGLTPELRAHLQAWLRSKAAPRFFRD